MSQFTLRTAFGLACLCTVGAGVLVVLEPWGSAPFWIAVWTLIIAIAFLATVVTAVRTTLRRFADKGGDVQPMVRQDSQEPDSFGL